MGDGLRIEVKTYFAPTVDAFVECYQRSAWSDQWKPSGINTTEADWWMWVNQSGTAVHGFTTSVLRLVVANRIDHEVARFGRPNYTEAGLRGDNPTKGYWFAFRYLQGRALDVGSTQDVYNQEVNDQEEMQ